MPDRKRSGLAYVAFAGILVLATEIAPVVTQERESLRPDLSGRWQLNRDLSEDAREKLQSMGGGGDAGGGHGPGRHGGIFGGGQAAHEQLDEVIRNAPTSFVLAQDDTKVVLTEPDGRVRTLPTNDRKVKVDGRDVKTKWENNRLVSEITVSNAKVIQTYERAPRAPQLVVTTRIDMRGRQVSVRRVYDAVTR